MSKSSSSQFQRCKNCVKRTPDAKDIAFWSLAPTGKIFAEVPRGTPSSCHVVVKKCILMTWHENVSWWCGMMIWHADMAWWCGMMTWHVDVAWWHGMVTWHDEVAWWLAYMHLCVKWVLGHSCIYSWEIVKWLIFEVSGKITHMLLIYFIPWIVMKLMHGYNQKQTCHICKEVVTSWFMVEKPTCYLKKGFCYVMDYCWIL